MTYAETGKPAANVKVCATDGSSPCPKFVSEIAVTDTKGHYLLRHIPPYHFSVSVILKMISPILLLNLRGPPFRPVNSKKMSILRL